MRCEHVVEKKNPLTRKWRPRPCRLRLKSVIPKLVVGDLTWHVYRCRRGHATRFYVEPRSRPSTTEGEREKALQELSRIADGWCTCCGRASQIAELLPLLAQPREQPVDVVAAVRRDEDGNYWLCRRGANGKHAGLANMWEYPGGKVKPNEQLRDALVRELQEEFPGVHPVIGEVLDSIEATYGDTTYRVTFFAVEMEDPTELRCHTEARFMSPREACSVEHLPSGTIFNARHLTQEQGGP